MSDAAVQTVQISNRFSLPFFPMRPRLGTIIAKLEDMDSLDPEYH